MDSIADQELVEGIRQLPVLSWLQYGAGTAVGFVTNFVLVMIFVVYLLLGRHPNELRSGIYAEIDAKVRNYIVIKFLVVFFNRNLLSTEAIIDLNVSYNDNNSKKTTDS